MHGPDLPPPDQGFTADEWSHRWPTGTRKAELSFGILVFAGQFDQRDVVTATNCYPGRQVLLNEEGGIEVHPASDIPAMTTLEMSEERHAARQDQATEA
jgi:hypothetical protein